MRLRAFSAGLGTAALAAASLFAGAASATRLNSHVHCGGTVKTSLTLSANLDCSSYSGTALTLAGAVKLNLGGHTLTANPGYDAVDLHGDYAKLVNGRITGAQVAVHLDAPYTHARVSGLTITHSSYGVDGDYAVAATITSNTITGPSDTGIYLDYGSSNLVSKNVVSSAGDSGIHTYEETHDLITRNAVSSSLNKNYYDSRSDLNRFVKNTSIGSYLGFYFEENGVGAVIVKGNSASHATGDGFNVYEASSAYNEAPWTRISGNTAKGNAVYGFYDYNSLNEIWTRNVASKNGYDGFYFYRPARYVIKENVANKNGGSGSYPGFYLQDNESSYDALAFSQNIATNNSSGGFDADYGTPGSGNIASGNGGYDCYSVVCAEPPIVSTRNLPGLGEVLVNGDGHTLYAFVPDHRERVTCTGACTAVWHPLTLQTGQTAKASGKAEAALLGSDRNPSGGRVVTYAGWPLYTYTGDHAPGTADGQALNRNGGLWFVLSPSGKLIRNGGSLGNGVRLRGIGDYDPQGIGAEHSRSARRATDGNPATFWRTETYANRDFGGLKDGIGLVLDAGRRVKLTRLTITTPTPGFTVRIRTGNSRHGPFAIDSPAQRASRRTTFKLEGRTARYYVVWITRLPRGDQAKIAEVTASH